MKIYRLFITVILSLIALFFIDQNATAQVVGATQKTLSHTFLDGLRWGFISVLQPCLYAMFPVTVTFFLKRSQSRAQGIKNATLYSFSIIAIFTAFAFFLTLIFGKDTLYQISTSATFNIFVFILFMVFGISFLGAFEITLPSSWTNKVDSKASTNNFSGIFFMALTLVLVSFSCTAPFIGNLLVDVTQQKERLGPIIGFLGFSLAIALPFALFAFFPGLLNKIAKSGGWLNTLKVSFGFIEIAMALKFLSNADLAYHWRLLDREVYLSLWIIIFGLLGFYLLGKLKFSHDDHLPLNDYGHPYLSVTRLLFAIIPLAFTVYMIPGLWGAPLNGISGWLPENKTQDFNLEKLIRNSQLSSSNNDSSNAGKTVAYIRPKKYTDILASEIAGVETFFDFNEAIAAARAMNKPVMIDFTGHSCANCRKMESEVLSKPEVSKRLHDDFVVVSLYVDEKRELPDSEKYVSKFDQSSVNTVGAKNLDFEATIANSNAQPLYIFVDESGKIIQNAGGYDPDINRFISILNQVKAENMKRFQ
ncbi:thioredoxin fold domain-containing protein [Ginsengibacter hankyongi]|uniref:Thioredoxin fold domain-containing protein n=1 Tax=Ginsengibacter hankyongi TaxID=2607284 RepID=A0A5J5IPH3_9BACT|nr:thioredoxin family protein [Ginsengibacter hankyongi]KAA9041422.1 thioredoxin fold domain-containing protein [Ginsengibacter hankyongi]